MPLTNSDGIGIGQTWQTVTRVNGTTYTNTTGKPIMLNIGINAVGGATNTIYINGAVVGSIYNPSQLVLSLTYIVPPNATYSVTGGALSFFMELR